MGKGSTADPRRDGIPLNPALKKAHDASYGANYRPTDPMMTVSTKGTEGRPWPFLWAAVVVLSVLAAIAFLVF